MDKTTVQSQAAVLEHLCRGNTILLYVFFDGPEDVEYEFGRVVDDTDTTLTISWRVVRSSSGCEGMEWQDHYERGGVPMSSRWLNQVSLPLTRLAQGLPGDGLVWCCTHVNKLS